MNLPDVPFLSLLRERLSWLSARQNVLSQNVANVDTPGYTTHDLKPLDFEELLRRTNAPQGGSLTIDDPRHIQIASGASSFDDALAPDITAGRTGNTVSLEQEMIKVSDTQAQFAAASNLYSKAMQMMRTAVHGP